MTRVDDIFKSNLRDILDNGSWDENPRPKYESDGKPANTLFITDVYEKYYSDETPITNLRPIAWKSAIREMMVIYQMQSNKIKDFESMDIDWWKQWCIGDGTIGKRYGHTVRRYDLVNNLLNELKENPFGRRHIMSLWQEQEFIDGRKGLAPCAFMTMWSVRKNKNGEYCLDLSLTQRSSDFLTAGHINLIQYKALQMMVAKHLSYKVGTFSRHTMNLHIYDRHIPQLVEIMKREYFDDEPKLILNVPDRTDFYDISIDNFEMIGYNPIKPQLKFELGI